MTHSNKSACAIFVGAALCLWSAPGPSTIASAQTFTDAGFASEVVTSLPPFTPSGLTWAPDGRMFIWQRNGIVRIFKNGQLLATPFINISSQVNVFTDRGLLGLALHPNFSQNGYVYLFFTREEGTNPNDTSPKVSRLLRVQANPGNPDQALAGSETIILGSISTPPCSNHPIGADCIPTDNNTHSAGAVHFGADGKLYVAHGDGATAAFADPLALRSQDLNSYAGKILRINDDGAAPGDNPFDDLTNSIRSKVWIYGVRQPYRWNFHPTTGELFIGEVGWDTWESIKVGIRGRNYGWPCYEGNLPQPLYMAQFSQCAALPSSAVTFPIVTWAHTDASPALPGYNPSFLGDTAIGGPIYTGTAYPQLYSGNYFFADYVNGFLRRLVFDASGNVASNIVFGTGLNGIVSLEQGPDGRLYYIHFPTGEIRRIKFNGPVAKATAAPTSGYSPLTVTFSSTGSINPVGGTLTYLWEFGDATTSTAANPVHTYATGGVTSYNAQLTITDTLNQSSSGTVKVTVGSRPPTPTIVTPATGTGVQPGQTVFYQGTATDPDEILLPSALSWQVLLHHNDHIHTSTGSTGTSGSLVAQYHGVGTYSYEIILTATDSSGLQGSTSVTLPVLPDITPPSSPSGVTATTPANLQINLTWTAATDDTAVTSYKVERCQGIGCTAFVQIAATATTSYSDIGLTASTTYRYQVRAADATGNLSNYTAIATATTLGVPNLVAAYAFNAGTGTAVTDASGNNNTGTITGATWNTTGRFGNSLTFNGTSNVVLIPAATSLNLSTAMTLEAWVFPTAAQNGWRTILQREPDAYLLHAGSENFGALQPTAGGTFGSTFDVLGASSAMPLNTWSHVALTWDGGTMRLYVNGTQVATKARTGTLQAVSTPVRIGANSYAGENFLGRIDEVRIYSRALSAAEITTDMNTPVGPQGPPDTTPPTAPGTTTATAVGSTQINLSWIAATDNIGVTGYRVERCAGATCGTFVEVSQPTGLSFSDTGLTSATTYRYQVRAVDAAGNLGSYAAIASATTLAPDTIPPTVPTAVTGTGSSATQVNLSWTASTDASGIAGYSIERCQGGTCTNFVQVGTTTTGTGFIDTGLTASTTYRYQVRAVDAAGNFSGYSSIISATTTGGTVPTGLVAAYAFNAGTGTAVTDASGNNNTGTITGATWNTTGRFGNSLTFNGTSNVVLIPAATSLNLSTAMTLEAWVFPTAAQNGWRTILQREPDAYLLHAGSENFGALQPTAGGTFGSTFDVLGASSAMPLNTWSHVALTWDGGTMRLYVNGTQVATKARTGTLQAVSTPVRIGANSYAGENFLGRIDEVRIYSRALSAAEITTDMNTPVGPQGPPDTTPPTAPGTTTATAVGSTQINLSWIAATDNIGVTGYRVERCAGATCGTFVEVSQPTGLSFSDTGLTSATTYRYQVRAVDAAGNLGSYAAIASATTLAPDTIPPTVPTAVTGTGSSATQVNLSWTASTDASGIAGYSIERCQGGTCTNFVQVGTTTTGTGFIDTGLTASTTYRYQVRAVDAAGNFSGYSSIISATTTGGTVPTGLVAAYAFNAGTGTAVTDASGNNNTGTITGATWNTTGRFGNSLTFNGTSNVVLIPAATSLNLSTAMTLEAWVFPTAAQNGWRTILQREPDAYLLHAGSENFGALQPTAGGTFGSTFDVLGASSAMPLNTWSHVALTWDGGTMRLYVNGTQVATKARTGTLQAVSTPVRIGANSYAGENFLGRIDEVRIYSRALSAAEITTDMNTPITP